MAAKPETIDAYLATVSSDRRVALEKLRKTTLSILPDAEECISSSMPAFRYAGHVVAGFSSRRVKDARTSPSAERRSRRWLPT
jgi:uncharacterized protein YdhG (YjbR/CyaY superfamily)